MAYECLSRFFENMPEELRAEDSVFRRGVRALAENRARLGDLEEELYEISRNPRALRSAQPTRDLAEALGPTWDQAEVDGLVRAAATFDLAIHEFADDDSESWVADLVGLGFLAKADAEALIEDVTAMHARHHVRARTDEGVLPAFGSLGYTTEIRGGMHEGQRLRLAGICSVALHLDTDDTTYFQLNRAQLQKLIATLQKAEEELSVLERSIAVQS